MKIYTIQSKYDRDWIVDIRAINCKTEDYCYVFYIDIDREIWTASYPTRNWQIIEVVYGD
jgi:hypothetical protein